MKHLRIIIAGGRDFNDAWLMKSYMSLVLIALSDITNKFSFVSGEARGADKMGAAYARHLGAHVDLYPADWNRYGKSAGYIRNSIMADNAEVLVAFWDGKSRGTEHMIKTAKAKGLMVFVCNY